MKLINGCPSCVNLSMYGVGEPASAMYTSPRLSTAIAAGRASWPGSVPFVPHASTNCRGGKAGFAGAVAVVCDDETEQPAQKIAQTI